MLARTGKLTDTTTGRITRTVRRKKQPRRVHVARSRPATRRSIGSWKRVELPFEFMLNALRLVDGFELARFAERTGLPLSAIARPLEEAERRGLVTRDLHRVRPTARGFDFLNDLLALFLPAA